MRQILFSITRPKFSNCLTTDSALSSGEVPTIAALAKTEGVSASYISLKISLAFLAPDILETIIDGMQPMSLTAGAAQEGLPPARFLGRAARLPAGLNPTPTVSLIRDASVGSGSDPWQDARHCAP